MDKQFPGFEIKQAKDHTFQLGTVLPNCKKEGYSFQPLQNISAFVEICDKA